MGPTKKDFQGMLSLLVVEDIFWTYLEAVVVFTWSVWLAINHNEYFIDSCLAFY